MYYKCSSLLKTVGEMLSATRLAAIFLLFLNFVVGDLDAGIIPKLWENLELHRTIDVSRSYTQELVDIRIKNIHDEPVRQYYFVLPEEVFDAISLFSSTLKGVDAYIESAIMPEQNFVANGRTIKVGVIGLPSPIEPGHETSILLNLVYNSRYQPYPGHVDLGEEQKLLLRTNRFPISAYNTQKYTLEFQGSSSFEELQSFNGQEHAGTVANGKMVVGPFDSIMPYEDFSPIEVVFEHNTPLPRVSHLKRDIWVSHWASSLQFEEYYELINDAAPLKSGFSRADYMKGQHALKKGGHLTALEMILPDSSEAHYCTDLVGAVSTFKVLKDHFFLKPRYPLFGNWKYNFTVGWTNQLSQFLHSQEDGSDTYILSFPILNGPADTVYDSVSLSIYLPEGAEVLDVWCPLPVQKTEVTTEKSYFDLNQGHTKVNIELKNLIDRIAGSEAFVRYKVTSTTFYKKPFSIAVSVFTALMAYFFLKHISLMIDS